MKVMKEFEYTMVDEIYSMCNREQYFTCGSNRQYDLMFTMAKKPEISTRDLAMMIFTCSDGASLESIQGNGLLYALRGKGRVVTVSPKIKAIIEARSAAPGAFLFGDASGGQFELQNFTERYFYPALDAAGIDNPIVEVAGGAKRHKYTPHTCRHTFSTLMKRVQGVEKDKLELMGHSSGEMLRYYQDVAVDDLRRITDAL